MQNVTGSSVRIGDYLCDNYTFSQSTNSIRTEIGTINFGYNHLGSGSYPNRFEALDNFILNINGVDYTISVNYTIFHPPGTFFSNSGDYTTVGPDRWRNISGSNQIFIGNVRVTYLGFYTLPNPNRPGSHDRYFVIEICVRDDPPPLTTLGNFVPTFRNLIGSFRIRPTRGTTSIPVDIVNTNPCRDFDLSNSTIRSTTLNGNQYCNQVGYNNCDNIRLQNGNVAACSSSITCNSGTSIPYCWVLQPNNVRGYDSIRCCNPRQPPPKRPNPYRSLSD
ncbi:MAG TPA: hypothetical protein VJI68_00915 [Candidatus Nanoarchaeia archaeon]|nr:hypothetical protein [Candidatus Nanoarchaeia archaeon]